MTYREIKRKVNHFTFVWAITKLMDMGIHDAKEILDTSIEIEYQAEIQRQEIEDKHCMYTPEVVRDMLITVRELAQLDFQELMNGIVADDLWKAHSISWDRMCEIASKTIDGLREDDEYEAREYLRNEVELDDDEAEFFGVLDLWDGDDE